jgi:sporulation protein YlmC with PRC-barrel domain
MMTAGTDRRLVMYDTTPDSNPNPTTRFPSETPASTPMYAGKSVIDEHGETLGSVDDVIFDVREDRPEYLLVNPGILHRSHYIPVEGTYESIDGDIVAPWDRHWFKESPTATRDHVLTSTDRDALEAHYVRH